MNGLWLCAAGAWGQCAPAALDRRFWAAPQLRQVTGFLCLKV